MTAMVVSVQADMKNFTTEMDRGMKKIDQFSGITAKSSDNAKKFIDSFQKLGGISTPILGDMMRKADGVKTGFDAVRGTLDLVRKNIIRTNAVQQTLNASTSIYAGMATGGIALVAMAFVSIYNEIKTAREEAENFEKTIKDIEDRIQKFNAGSNSIVSKLNTKDTLEAAQADLDSIRTNLQELTALQGELEVAKKQNDLYRRSLKKHDVQGNRLLVSLSGMRTDANNAQQIFDTLGGEDNINALRDREKELLEAEKKAMTLRNVAIHDEKEKRLKAEQEAIKIAEDANRAMIEDRAKALYDEIRKRAEARKKEKQAEEDSFKRLEESLDPALKKMREYEEAEKALVKARDAGFINDQRFMILFDALNEQFRTHPENKEKEIKQQSNAAMAAGSTEAYKFLFGGENKELKVLQDSLAEQQGMRRVLEKEQTRSRSGRITFRVVGA